MGVYIDYADILAAADENTIERSTDENQPGTSNQDHVNNLIAKAEKWFEGYAAFQEGSDLTALRLAKPELAQDWIVAKVVRDLYGRRAIPAHVQERYLEAKADLENYSKTGVPQLITEPPIVAAGLSVSTNMTEADLDVMPEDCEAIVSVWKGLT